MKDIRIRLSDNQRFEPTLHPDFPRNMLVELTNACNHRCVFCTNRKMTRPIGHIGEAFLHRLLHEAFALGVREVGFYTTGEPFASPGLARYVGEAKRIGFTYVYITTNGVLATPERARAVIDAGLDSMKFSINAGTREGYARIHGRDDFQTVMRNLAFVSGYRQTLDRPFRIYASYVVTQQTREEQAELKERIEPLVDDILFVNVGNQGGLMFEVNEGLTVDGSELARQPPCPMLFNRIHITYEGYLSACCVDYQNYLVVADLNETSLAEAWHSDAFVELRRKHLDNALEGTLCYNCLFNRNDAVEPVMPQHATLYDTTASSTGAGARNRPRGSEDSGE